jgi:hypothetical protein
MPQRMAIASSKHVFRGSTSVAILLAAGGRGRERSDDPVFVALGGVEAEQ